MCKEERKARWDRRKAGKKASKKTRGNSAKGHYIAQTSPAQWYNKFSPVAEKDRELNIQFEALDYQDAQEDAA